MNSFKGEKERAFGALLRPQLTNFDHDELLRVQTPHQLPLNAIFGATWSL